MEAERTYHEIVTKGSRKLADLAQALRGFLGTNDMMAYLVMMAIRLAEMRRILKPSGSLYIHCDPTASHYLKILLDSIFGAKNFRNEIIWKRTSAHSDPGRYGANIDILLFVTKSSKWTWNQLYRPHDSEYISRFRLKEPDGRRWADYDLTAKGLSGGGYEYEYRGVRSLWRCPLETMERLDREGRLHFTKKGGIRLKRYLDDTPGVVLQSLWDDIPPINSQARERLGYPTQKPEALLERIIKASSNEGDIILDPFCGCGTTLIVAENLHRRWVGIDITHLAVALMRHRLEDSFGEDLHPYEVLGDPKDLNGARALAEQDRFQFELWAIGLIGARPGESKIADSGIDGYLYFFDDDSGNAKEIVVQVKSGHVGPNQIRDLKGVMEREGAPIGAFITLEEPTASMKKEAASTGIYTPELFPNQKYSRLQILTIEDLLNGKELQYPRYRKEFIKKAKRKVKNQRELL